MSSPPKFHPQLARSSQQIGNVVRRARRSLKLTQAELAEKVGVRQETISLIEAGNPATKIETLLKILGILDLEFQIAPRAQRSRIDIEDIF